MLTTRDNLSLRSGHALRRSLRASVKTFERRYEMSSEDMVHILKAGALKETRELSIWLQRYMVLKKLTGTAGTRSKTT